MGRLGQSRRDNPEILYRLFSTKGSHYCTVFITQAPDKGTKNAAMPGAIPPGGRYCHQFDI